MHSSRSRVPLAAAGLTLAAVTMLGTGCDHAASQPSPGVTPSASAFPVLHNSYWNINASSRPDVLAEIGAPTQLPVTPTCGAGMGCNPMQATFTALRPGTAVLSASRMTCGEALACAPAQRHFQVTVVVTQ